MSFYNLPEVQEFILHWGEMGTHWGANRSVAQVHALLYLADRPLNAEEICGLLTMARSNVSTALKELQGYGIITRTHISGDRRDHFVAETDLWELFLAITAERKRREIDPTIAKLADLQARMQHRDDIPEHVRTRIGRMHEFISSLTNWYSQIRGLKKSTLITLMKLGAKVARFIPGGGKDISDRDPPRGPRITQL